MMMVLQRWKRMIKPRWACLIGVWIGLVALPASAQPQLTVVYPKEGDEIFVHDSTFVFGHTSPLEAPVFVNGIRAKKYANGTFMVVVPVRPGTFTFWCSSIWQQDTVTVKRTVHIPPYLQAGPTDSLGMDTTFIFPNRPLELQPGDRATFLMKGTPGKHAFVSLPGIAENIRMQEVNPRKPFRWRNAIFANDRPPRLPRVKGIYIAGFALPSVVSADSVPVQYTLRDRSGRSVRQQAPFHLTIIKPDGPRVALLQQPMTIGRPAPGRGRLIFLPEGVRLWITGRDGEFYRVRLTQKLDTWVPVASVRFLPQGTPLPSSDVQVLRTKNFPDRSQIIIRLRERLPFEVRQSVRPQQLILRLFGVISEDEWIRDDFIDPYIREIQWRRDGDQVSSLVVQLNTLQQWGYRAYYEGTRLIFEIRKPPRFTGTRQQPLKGLLICVDPGHAPDDGALGPSGITEKEATLLYANTIKEMLEQKGAEVFLTREDHQGLNLASRTKLAEAMDAHLFISIHFNALPDGVNPFIIRGTSTYYYHPQSRPLAKFVQKQLLRRTKLPNFGLRYDNLAVCRITWMPSILVEPAFIMHPLEEMRIRDTGFQRAVADGIVKGILEFVNRARAEN